MRLLPVLVFVAAAIAACGGSKPPASAPAESSPPPAATTAPPDSASGNANANGAGAGNAQKPTLESQREDFMRGCMRKVNAPDYCDCSFEQFKIAFKDADLSKELPEGDPRLAELGERTKTQCASKLTEEAVKPKFLSDCSGDDKRKAPYCTCAWTSLRKSMSIADFLRTDELGSRFEDAKRAMVKTCKGKYPADLAKSDFMIGCRKGDSASPKTCECLWKKISGKFSAEEIVAGTADVKSVPGLADCRKP